VFKDNALLYIGRATDQTFGERIKQENWWKDEWDLTVYLGRIESINDNKFFNATLRKEVIEDAEALLIYFHSPPYNASSIANPPRPKKDLRIINRGDSGELYMEVSHKGLRIYK